MKLPIRAIAIIAILCSVLPYCATAQRRTKRAKTEHRIPVYDTIRVVVTDTVRVEPVVAPRIDTLGLALSPAETDSLVELWSRLAAQQSDKRFFEPYAVETETERSLPIDSLYKTRLLDLVSPVHLPYNYIVRGYINQYLHNRWSPLSRILAMSKYYFPIIEQELVNAGLPIELRAVAIVESNLSNLATSRMGAVGMWQLMPATGKNLGLEINSLVDERCDPVLSTRAACRFLRDLYRIYGDWTLAIAAYNCGPGNVNKAIARAGANGKTFWDIYDFLPRETRGYVPKFIAASYAYAYHRLHGIHAETTPQHIATDTVAIDRVMHLGQVASTIDIPIETLRALNPQYKMDIVPASRKRYSLTLPVSYLSEFIENRDSIYAKDSLYLKEFMNPANLEKQSAQGVGYIYEVKAGDNLSIIASRNRVTVKDLMRWNHLTSTTIRIGQKLRIEKPRPRN